MHRDAAPDPRPLAEPAQERLARDVFPLHLSPGVYAARHGDPAHGCFGYEQWRYRDPKVTRWIDAVAQILRSPALLAACRERDRGAR